MGSYRQTSQRKLILDFIRDNYTHPTVDEVFSHVKKSIKNISKKTVYANLKMLAEKCDISEVQTRGVQRFEPKTRPHHHAICKKCGKVIDFVSDELIDEVMSQAKKIRNFTVEEANANFYGVCGGCRDGKV